MPDDADIHTLRGYLRQRGWRGPKGPIQRALRDTVRHFLENGKTQFTLREVMDEANLNFEDYHDHITTSRFLSKMRKVVSDFADFFWTRPEYAEYVHDGLTDKALFGRLVAAMASYEIYPLWYDSERNDSYELLPIEGYMRIVRQRGVAIKNEIERRATELHLLQQKFPMIASYASPQLETDGRFLAIPASERFQCPICEMKWASSVALQRHIGRRHPGAVVAPPEAGEPAT